VLGRLVLWGGGVGALAGGVGGQENYF
jgi:hypothetical protein